MALQPCPACDGGPAAAREPARSGSAASPSTSTSALSARAALDWIRELELTETERAIARLIVREIEERLSLPRRGRDRLPDAGARGDDALGRRGAADPARDADRLEPRRRPLHPRRAVDRPAPARQREADRHPRAPPRPRQHGDRRRARRGHDPRRRLRRRPRPGRRRARRPGRRRGHPEAGRARWPSR